MLITLYLVEFLTWCMNFYIRTPNFPTCTWGGGGGWLWVKGRPRWLIRIDWGYRIPVGMDICHRGCAYTVLQTVQRHGVYSATYGTVHYKEPLTSFEIIE